MMKKILSLSLAFLMLFAVFTPQSFAEGAKQAAASLFVPTTGQAMNGQLGNTKTKIMGATEVALITTVAILGGVVGGGVIWAGLGPLIGNHLWSATDAYHNAQNPQQGVGQPQYPMAEAQRTLELSRQRRFEREQVMRSDIRDRILQAGEQAGR